MIQAAQAIDQLCITTIRTLVMDAVQRANSGHPGSPMGMAMSVGMAVAERWAASYFNRPGFDLIDCDVYALCADGCLSEVALCLEAYEKLTADGIKTRVISMPSWELFELQSQEYRESVIPPDVSARVSVEEASTFGWSQYVGTTGESIGMHTFGASAPLKELQKKFGFTPERVVSAAKAQLARQERSLKERSHA